MQKEIFALRASDIASAAPEHVSNLLLGTLSLTPIMLPPLYPASGTIARSSEEGGSPTSWLALAVSASTFGRTYRLCPIKSGFFSTRHRQKLYADFAL